VFLKKILFILFAYSEKKMLKYMVVLPVTSTTQIIHKKFNKKIYCIFKFGRTIAYK